VRSQKCSPEERDGHHGGIEDRQPGVRVEGSSVEDGGECYLVLDERFEVTHRQIPEDGQGIASHCWRMKAWLGGDKPLVVVRKDSLCD
jgi:hypothetical protein